MKIFRIMEAYVTGPGADIYMIFLCRKWPASKVVLACTVAFITSICSYGLPFLASCKPCPGSLNSKFSCPTYGRAANFKSFNCPAGQYNDLATLFFNTNDDAIRNLFSTGTPGEFRVSTLLIYLVSTYSLALVTYGIAVPSGLFVPAILCGSTYGRIMGIWMNSAVGAKAFDEGVYALLGAASFLGGSMRMTVSLCIILLELTNSLKMLPVIMVVLLVSKAVGDSFNDGIYDTHVRLKGFPFLDAHPEPFMRRLSAADAITSPPVQVNCFLLFYSHFFLLSNNQ
jgi:chloride channel 7